jgi:hypothetical protein
MSAANPSGPAPESPTELRARQHLVIAEAVELFVNSGLERHR